MTVRFVVILVVIAALVGAAVTYSVMREPTRRGNYYPPAEPVRSPGTSVGEPVQE